MSEPQPASDAVSALTPLKVVIVAEKDLSPNDDRIPYFDSITRAFQGGSVPTQDGSEAYYASGEELGVDVRRFVGAVFWSGDSPTPDVNQLLQSCGHLLLVIFLEGSTSAESTFGRWLKNLATIALSEQFDGRIGILPIALDPDAENAKLSDFNEFQRLPIADLGEATLRAGYLGLLALQNAWKLVGTGMLEGEACEDRMRLFVSHAKRDGAPIALALKSQIESLRFLQRFYDAQDILPGTRWRKVLQDSVRKSMLVVLRTDIYEQRPWCVQELEWAQQYGCPAVVVDLRNSLTMPRETLPVSGMATVRIGDGNLIRILNAAMREALRVRLFRREIKLLEDFGALPENRTIGLTRASLSALGVICDDESQSARQIDAVVVSEPFRESERPAAERLVRAYFNSAILGTRRYFAAHGFKDMKGAKVTSRSQVQSKRKLDDWVIGISVGESEDLAEYGYVPDDVNRITARLCEALLSSGARLVFGHDWRPDGILDVICRMAVQFQTQLPKRGAPKPLVHILLAWPNEPQMEPELRSELEQRGVLKVEKAGIPESGWSNPKDSTARAIGLTAMRRELANNTDARVCLGGKVKSAEGFFAGVIEEAYNATIAKHPIYVGRFLGGAAAKLVAAVQNPKQDQPALRVLATKATELKATRKKASDLVPEEDLSGAFKPEPMQKQSGLDPTEWQSLLNATDIEAFSTLVIRGLSQLTKPAAESSELDEDNASASNMQQKSNSNSTKPASRPQK